MFATYAYSPHLVPTTPPPTFYYDGAAIVDDSIYDESDTRSACQASPPCFVPQFMVPGAILPLPLALARTSSKPLRLRPETEASPTPSLVMDQGSVRRKMDMNMAATGSVAAQPGIHTPLASYAAQMVVWLWFGRQHPPLPKSSSPLSTTTPISQDPFDLSRYPSSPLNPLQVQPSEGFSAFVARLLQITMVSHSVTLVALLYIYRLKARNAINAEAGSETRPLIASLILSNKYLDDNTYTNATWAELAGLTTVEINNMEAEFLRGMDYDLGVQLAEYQHWRKLLDGFIVSRQREAVSYRSRPSWTPAYSPQSVIYTPASTIAPPPSFDGARSASPHAWSPKSAYLPPIAVPNSPGPVQRKRSALDAFDHDIPLGTSIYEQVRLPARKAAFGQSMTPAYTVQPSMPVSGRPRPQTIHQDSGLSRSSSLNRQIARIPSGRRGSAGQAYYDAPEADLRHAATNHAQMQEWDHRDVFGGSSDWNGYSALMAPYERPMEVQAVPPQHLMFYSLAAESHPGQDGAPRKAILCYQDPNAHSYPPQPQHTYQSQPRDLAITYNDPSDLSNVHPYSFPPMTTASRSHYEPEPAQFANAGPPGYAYNPVSSSWEQAGNRWSTGSEEHRYPSGSAAPLVWKTRSEWSSPMPGYEGWHPQV